MIARPRRKMPRKRTCTTCFGTGSLELISVLELRCRFEQEACPACAGLGVER